MQIYYFPIKSPSPLHPVFAGVGLAFAPVLPEEERDCFTLSFLQRKQYNL